MHKEDLKQVISGFANRYQRLIDDYYDDLDFQRLLVELKDSTETLSYLKNLVNIPFEKMEKDIKEKEAKVNELKTQIRLFLDEISNEQEG